MTQDKFSADDPAEVVINMELVEQALREEAARPATNADLQEGFADLRQWIKQLMVMSMSVLALLVLLLILIALRT